LLLGLLPFLSFTACSNASRTAAPVPVGVGSSEAADPAGNDPKTSSSAEPASTHPAAPDQTPDNSQTGSVGQSDTPECEVDADCVDTDQSGPIGSVELIGSQCMHLSVTSELPLCECSLRITSLPAADAGTGGYSFVAQAFPGNRPGGCSESSRSGGCLYCASEFPGCDIRDPHSCEAVCADVAQREDEEDRKSFDVRTRLARCVADHTNICHFITEVAGQCYVGRFGAWSPPLDCTLSDDELAAHFNDPEAEPCGPRPAVSCTRSEDCPGGLACTNGVCQSCEQRCTITGAGETCVGGGVCAADEICARGTCVPSANAACGWQDDAHQLNCPAEQQCYVTGISSTGRGNESSQSFCAGSTNEPAPRPQE
jgi:hypothetical protein